jgi:hypothetical protein
LPRFSSLHALNKHVNKSQFAILLDDKFIPAMHHTNAIIQGNERRKIIIFQERLLICFQKMRATVSGKEEGGGDKLKEMRKKKMC